MSMDKPTVTDVLPLVRSLYKRKGGEVGCCLHIVLDDGNVNDGHVDFCEKTARDSGHEDCLLIAGKLKLMSKTQRIKIYRSAR